MIDLAGRHALIAGSTQGIGRATAATMARLGARVTLIARNTGQLREVRDSLPRGSAGEHDFLAADFSDPASVRTVVTGYLAKQPPFQILVNNTGGPPAGPVFEATEEAFLAAFRMHVLCNQALVQAVVPGMRAAHWGRIVNIVSTSVREPIKGLGVSNTIRAAVAGWAKTLSRELGPDGITVNNVLPGYTRTGRLESIVAGRASSSGLSPDQITRGMEADIALGRFADAGEIAAAVAFLASDAASYITGVSLPVDGGRLLSI